MAKPTLYRQVKVVKPVPELPGGITEWVFYTPIEHAIVGKEVKVEIKNGIWEEGWTVAEVYAGIVNQDYVNKAQHAHTKQRAASDI